MRYARLGLCFLLLSSSAWAAPKPETVTVVMVDNRFEPDHVIFHAGRPTELRLENRGKDMHEFTAPDFLHASKIQDRKRLSNGGGDIVVQPGQTVTVRLVPGHAGNYKLICADHDWDGMVGSITVQP
ncbi:MAG TPA: cupredoxin domain-containing protein [Rhodopila sp.]|uniref:cupredoxin domain-containing protein n=1 Tax=Rhodopila sp. TaxID=2480087 RepID=UPI002BEB5C16|nr:cupredoxin domain-containing protein [Rhodopila sp.]HVY16692.1 cupredoxin domain-containing protein [Rhodopila sp.]